MKIWIRTILIVAALAAMAGVMSQLPPEAIVAWRFLMTVLLVWLVQQALVHQEMLRAHRDDLKDVMLKDREQRTKDLEMLRAQTQVILDYLSFDNKKTGGME